MLASSEDKTSSEMDLASKVTVCLGQHSDLTQEFPPSFEASQPGSVWNFSSYMKLTTSSGSYSQGEMKWLHLVLHAKVTKNNSTLSSWQPFKHWNVSILTTLDVYTFSK